VKVLHVIATLAAEGGGPSEAVRQLVSSYPDYGAAAEIVTQDEPSSALLSRFPVPVHALGGRKNVYGYSPELLHWLKENVGRFDAVVINGLWTYTSLAAAIATGHRIPHVVFCHGMLDPWFNRQYPLKRLKKAVYWPLQYWVLRNADAVMFTSPAERDLAPQSFWPNKWNAVVTPYGTSEPPANLEDQRRAWDAHLPALRGRRYLLFLSRIHEKKGCDLLVEAFGRLASRYPDVDLVIAGPDQQGLQSRLQAQAESLAIAGRVHWPGMLTGDLKWGAIRGCEAFILPSHQENFGIVVAESLACGRPVLISNQVNIWPDIAEDRVGFVAPDTLEGTQELLTRWLSLDESQRVEMAGRAHSTFVNRFSMASAARLLVSLFDGFLKNAKNGHAKKKA
jgi:glycosyltransferase involved in cell wall biosynthesis